MLIENPNQTFNIHKRFFSVLLCSLCRATDGHQWVNKWSGQSWHPLPGLSHLCHEGSLSRHWWSPCAPRAGGEGPLKRGCTTWIQFQLYFLTSWPSGHHAPKLNWFLLVGKCCQTALELSSVSKMSVYYSLWFELCLMVSTPAGQSWCLAQFLSHAPVWSQTFLGFVHCTWSNFLNARISKHFFSHYYLR